MRGFSKTVFTFHFYSLIFLYSILNFTVFSAPRGTHSFDVTFNAVRNALAKCSELPMPQ